ncbi:MAG: hypothetical protein M1814_005423 [Vezdaea aestivalis]|nr:MAG: hypothetical protein M1814_005423 [Vezdaea aestivalis]
MARNHSPVEKKPSLLERAVHWMSELRRRLRSKPGKIEKDLKAEEMAGARLRTGKRADAIVEAAESPS